MGLLMTNKGFLLGLKVAGDQPQDLRARAEREVKLLRRASIDSPELLVSALQNRKAPPELRRAACWALGQLRNKTHVTVLLNAFNERDVDLSWEAAKSLAAVKSKRALRPLIAALRHAGEKRRHAAAYALGWLGDERAIEPLIDALTDKSESPRVRGQAAESLGILKDRRAVRPLVGALKDPSVEVRFWSAFALGLLRDPRALQELRRLVKTDKASLPGWWQVRKEASDAIERILAKND